MEQAVQLTTRLIEQQQGYKEYHIAELAQSSTSDLVTIGVRPNVKFDKALFLQGLGLILASIQMARFAMVDTQLSTVANPAVSLNPDGVRDQGGNLE